MSNVISLYAQRSNGKRTLTLIIQDSLAERISDGGLPPGTDTNLLLAAYSGGSHLTSDIQVCRCDNPCTTSSSGRMVYIYPKKGLRAYSDILRGTKEWDTTYKIRTAVERDINHIKENLCPAGRRIQNKKTLHADLILVEITQLITVVLADKI